MSFDFLEFLWQQSAFFFDIDEFRNLLPSEASIKYIFDKGYLPKWSNEIFVIDKVLLKNPTKYLVKDLKDNEIGDIYFDFDLLKISKWVSILFVLTQRIKK